MAIASCGDEGVIGRAGLVPVGGGESGYIAPVSAGSEHRLCQRSKGYCHALRPAHRADRGHLAYGRSMSPAMAAEDSEHRFNWTSPLMFRRTIQRLYTRRARWCSKRPTTDRAGRHQPRPHPQRQVQAKALRRTDHHGHHQRRVLRHHLCRGRIAGAEGHDLGRHRRWPDPVTTDGGKNWNNVTPKDMPEWSLVSMIEASQL